MARIRTIKPSFFKHEELFDAEKSTGLPLRVAFSGLWTVCDREGRFAWKPRALKTDVLPYDDVDFGEVLDALAKFGFIVKYSADGREYGCVPSWTDHQVINLRETKSAIPARASQQRFTVTHVHARAEHERDDEDENHARGEGKGREEEGNGMEGHIIPPEMIARSVLTELALSGRDLAVVLEDVCRSALSQWPTAGDLRDALIKAHRDYEVAKPKLSYTKGAAKFFGEGDWRNPIGWPWKAGEQSTVNPIKPVSALEKLERQMAQ